MSPERLLSFHAEPVNSESSGMPVSRRKVLAEIESARLAVCARLDCRRQFSACGRCDHGRRYCSADCAAGSRRESLRRAGRAYQRTQRGRQLHAARQARYRASRAPVTHHSPPKPRERPMIVLSSARAERPARPVATAPGEPRLVGARALGAASACLVCAQRHIWHRVGFRVRRLRRERLRGADRLSVQAGPLGRHPT